MHAHNPRFPFLRQVVLANLPGRRITVDDGFPSQHCEVAWTPCTEAHQQNIAGLRLRRIGNYLKRRLVKQCLFKQPVQRDATVDLDIEMLNAERLRCADD
jgi:hypothetical protein